MSSSETPEVPASSTEPEEVVAPVEKKIKKKSTPSKRGFGRPFAKLPQPTLQARMDKLKKRIDKSKNVFEKAEQYYKKYLREADFRAAATDVKPAEAVEVQ